MTKTPKGPETPSAKSATIVSASTASDNLGLGNKPNSVKSHDSVKSNKPARIKRKQPGSNLGSVSSIATKASGNLTPPFTDGQLEDGDLDNRKGTHDVLYHGHVQTNMGLFFKKKEYVVLTETHLLRFKDFSQAAKSFPHMNREQHSKPQRHGSTPSFGSMYDLQTSSSKSSNEAESKNSIPLHHIVATYRADDGRPFFIVQIDYMDDTTIFAATSSAMQLMLQDPREADIWHSSIRAASMRAKLVIVQPIPQKTIGNITSILEAAMDHDSSRMEIFFAVHLGKQAAGKSSAEDVAAVATPLCYLVLGATKLHLISVPDVQDLGKQKQYKAHKTSYGIVSLVAIDFKENDNDAFDLHFRLPMQPKVILKLASCQAIPIATSLFKSIVHLKPQWLDYTFMYSGPPEVIEDPGLDLQEVLRDDTGCFDRTLIAYCQAYGCAAHNIRYEIRDDVEDYPQFALLPPQESRAYSMHELLAIFRSLRYNNTFQSLSFADVSLESLDGVFDTYGDEHVASSSRGNTKVKCQVNTQGTSLLHQEVQGIALKSYRLKRIDFSNTLPQRKLVTSYDDQSPSRGPTCALVSAIFPICGAVKFTQIDWIVLNGVDLSRADLEVMGPTLREAGANLRAVEIARCGFDETELGTFLAALRHQAGSVECINIANNIGRLAPGKIGELLQVFTRIRILNLCRAATSVGTDPVIDLEVLITWKLEQILLNGVAVSFPF